MHLQAVIQALVVQLADNSQLAQAYELCSHGLSVMTDICKASLLCKAGTALQWALWAAAGNVELGASCA